MIGILLTLIMGFTVPDYGLDTQYVPPVIEYVYVIEYVEPNCQEDEDWATVHWDTPAAREDSHGVTRMCVPRDQIVMEAIYELVKKGDLVWSWDLP